MNEVTFRYLAVFYDGSIRYFINMAELRKYMRNIPVSLVDRFDKYNKKYSLWCRCLIRF